ncbi:MAG: hypothetical protein HFF65_05075 [Oscillospiraceae bacterium]|jgi:nicotinamide riboside kinase|nr:hypothetical protein [Oscillospiraceae bacterium]
MLVAIFGESCTGKSTLAGMLKERLGGEIWTGKDYLRLAKDEAGAKKLFTEKLREAVTGGPLIYVIAEKEHLSLLPEGAVRVLATAELKTIKERFAARMRGNLPPPVAAMLERNHGSFDKEPHRFHVVSGETELEGICGEIAAQG